MHTNYSLNNCEEWVDELGWGFQTRTHSSQQRKQNKRSTAHFSVPIPGYFKRKHKIIAYIYEVSNKGANLNTIPRAMLFHSFQQIIFFYHHHPPNLSSCQHRKNNSIKPPKLSLKSKHCLPSKAQNSSFVLNWLLDFLTLEQTNNHQ